MNKNFSYLMTAYGCSSIGDWTYRIALPLLIYQMTNSAFSMALSMGLLYLPYCISSLAGGLVADNYNKKSVLIIGDTLSAIIMGGVWLAFYYKTNINFIYILIFLSGLIEPFYHPTFQSIIPSLVKKDNLAYANSLVGSIDNILLFLSPLMGGIFIASVGAADAILINSFSFILSSILIYFINSKNTPKERKNLSFNFIKSQLGEGIKAYNFFPQIKFGAWIFFVTNFSINMLSANYVFCFTEIFKLNATFVGMAFGGMGLGALVGSLIAPIFIKKLLPEVIIVYMTLFAGILTFILVVALNSVIIFTIILSIISGLGAINVVAYFTLRHTQISAELLGRVIAITRMIAFSSIPLGAMLGGLILDLTGFKNVILISALLRTFVAIIAIFSPFIRR